MLVIPDTSDYNGKIIGIDPGSNTLGVSILSFDIASLEPIAWTARTFKAEPRVRNSWQSEVHGDRLARIRWHEDNLFWIFCQEQPVAVAIESPYFSHLHPSAFEPLVQTVGAARNALYRYDAGRELYLIDPNSAKLAVGAKGGSKKDPVKDGLIRRFGHLYFGMIPVFDLDEHSCDGGAVAFCQLERFRQGV